METINTQSENPFKNEYVLRGTVANMTKYF